MVPKATNGLGRNVKGLPQAYVNNNRDNMCITWIAGFGKRLPWRYKAHRHFLTQRYTPPISKTASSSSHFCLAKVRRCQYYISQVRRCIFFVPFYVLCNMSIWMYLAGRSSSSWHLDARHTTVCVRLSVRHTDSNLLHKRLQKTWPVT